jgi:hypothetical protein
MFDATRSVPAAHPKNRGDGDEIVLIMSHCDSSMAGLDTD